MDNKKNSRPTFSLKWQVAIIFGLVLAITYGLISLISYWHFEEQLAQQRLEFHNEQARILEGLNKASANKLIQTIETLPLLDTGPTSAQSPDISPVAQLGQRLRRHWGQLQLTWELQLAQIYDAEGQLIEAMGGPVDAVKPAWITQTISKEAPLTLLHCEEECLQIIVVPLILAQQQPAVIVLGRNLVDFLLAYHNIAGTEAGILSAATDDPQPDGRTLPGWQLQIKALTNLDNTRSILLQAARQAPLETLLNEGLRVAHAGHSYELQLVPLGGAEKAYFVVLKDITASIELAHSSTRKTLLAGMIGFIFAATMLSVFLWSLLSRLRNVTSSLPLLATHAYDEARAHLTQGVGRRIWRDEIDLLVDSATELTRQLENMEGDIGQHNDRMDQKNRELAHERDFVTSLLSNAQAIILTQDEEGNITLINRFGAKLLGASEHELIGKPFRRYFTDDHDKTSGESIQDKLQPLNRDVAQAETILRANDGQLRTISWSHTRLRDETGLQNTILSVGLDLTGTREAEQKLAWLADHDELTGLFNRRRFQEEVGLAIELASRYNLIGALLHIDLDKFKYVNDTSGHQAGDHLLKLIADKLKKTLRTTDVVARIGGDEFSIILYETTAEYAQQTAQKLIDALSEMEIRLHTHQHRISACVGIALFPLHGSSVYDLMANADLAMFQAKQKGYGRIHLFSEDEQAKEQMQQLLIWKHRIEEALAHDHFIFHYQPILNIKDGTVSHYEALLRIQDPDGTIHPPGKFIGVAEQTGLIRDIDHYVMINGIKALAEWSRRGQPITLALNLSGTIMDAVDLLPLLQKQIRDSGIDPQRIIFEITETAAVVDLEAAQQMMQEMKGLGCRFALDDFGVGLSSFSYLQSLPVDYIKIDGSFIRDIADNKDNQLFVQALVQVAQGSGRLTVAEFVEDAASLAMLGKLDVDFGQGYYIGKPKPELLESIPPGISGTPPPPQLGKL